MTWTHDIERGRAAADSWWRSRLVSDETVEAVARVIAGPAQCCCDDDWRRPRSRVCPVHGEGSWPYQHHYAKARAALASLIPVAEKAGDRHMNDNPYPNASDTMHYELHTAWDEGYAEGFAAGRAAATPDPPEPNAAIRALMAAYNDSQSHAFRAAMVTAAGVIGQHYGDENPNADEFDGAGCCPEEDGFLRAKARAAATPDPPEPDDGLWREGGE